MTWSILESTQSSRKTLSWRGISVNKRETAWGHKEDFTTNSIAEIFEKTSGSSGIGKMKSGKKEKRIKGKKEEWKSKEQEANE